MSKIDQTFFRGLFLRAVVLPIAVGLLTTAIFISLFFRLIVADERVAHTNTVLTHSNLLMRTIMDAERGLRGYVISEQERFLEPYKAAQTEWPVELKVLRDLVADNPLQLSRLELHERSHQAWQNYADRVIEAVREKRGQAAELLVASGEGKRLTDLMRDQMQEFISTEEVLRDDRMDTTATSAKLLLAVVVGLSVLTSLILGMMGRRQLMLLSRSYEDVLQTQNEQNLLLQKQQWIKSGQTGLSEEMLGELKIPNLSSKIVNQISRYTDAPMAALYVANEGFVFHRTATYAFPKEGQQHLQFSFGEGLLGQAAKGTEIVHITDVPENYAPIMSGTGGARPRHLLIIPLVNDRTVNAVLELAFFQPPTARTFEFLNTVSETVSIAVKSARDRENLEKLLREVQNQAEELQTQQEELRVMNEELEEQTKMLKDSQNRLEEQQAELEQTNMQLEEQSQTLESQKQDLHVRNEDLQRAQKNLEEKARELRLASKYKSEFLANMSHELRTPLNSSLILAKLLADNRDGNLSKQQIEFSKQILSSGNDLLTLINDILDLSKVESGKLDIVADDISIKQIVTQLEKVFRPIADEKKLQFELSVAPEVPAQIFADRVRVEQILKNLLSNAMKFTPKGKVELKVSAAGAKFLSFAVTDTGIGIEPEQREVIFEAFRQADGTTNRKFGGTGLGLSISRDLAKLLGGRIEVQSEPGKGSVFSLTLPIRYEAKEIESGDGGLSASSGARNAGASASVQNGPPAAMPGLSSFSVSADYTPTFVPARTARVNQPANKEAMLSQASSYVHDDRTNLQTGDRLVLIIEDDKTFANVLLDLAHEMKFKCIICEMAEDGVQMAMALKPDAVLLDMKLPDHSGLVVLDRLKQNSATRHIPVHVISGADFSKDMVMQMGAIGYALKPVKREEIAATFRMIESKIVQDMHKVLVVEDHPAQREAICQLIKDPKIETVAVENGRDALTALEKNTFDCIIMDLSLPDMSGFELVEKIAGHPKQTQQPIIVYTGQDLSKEEEEQLRRYSQSVIIKGARSPERLLDEVTLFLHKVESEMDPERQRMLENLRHREKVFETKTVLLVDDDMRNIFALTSVLEQKGAEVIVARNGQEALEKLEFKGEDVDFVLMDIMMPIMDGYEAMREIRKQRRFANLPIIALTAKAMKDDRELCLQAGANDYLAKPTDLDKLLSLMRVWMSQTRGRV